MHERSWVTPEFARRHAPSPVHGGIAFVRPPIPRDRSCESGSLQRGVCELSVPFRHTVVLVRVFSKPAPPPNTAGQIMRYLNRTIHVSSTDRVALR
jgi:hypothetical protein